MDAAPGKQVPPGARGLAVVKHEDDPNIHAVLLRSLDALSADHTLPIHRDGTDEHAAPFHLDENALRSLQQFIEENGLASQTMQAQEQPNSNIDQSLQMLKTQQPTLPESIAQHYIPNRRQAVKILSDDERTARKQRIKQENKERKKKWREQNAERNKDNDLRCRVHKRANAMFGFHSSEQKKQFIEDEFRKRQLKRRGRDPYTHVDDSSQGDDAYTAFLNNPEFAKVFSDLITEKGLGNFTNDVPMLLEYLKTTLSPENLRSYFHMDGQAEEAAEMPYDLIPTALPEAEIEQAAVFDVGQTAALELQSPTRPDSAVEPEIMPEAPSMIQLITMAAPSPRLNVALETPTPLVHTIPQPAPPPLIPIPTLEAIPIAPIPLISNQVQSSPPPPLIPIPTFETIPIAPIPLVSNQGQSPPPPPQDRIRAFGFPPMMQSR